MPPKKLTQTQLCFTDIHENDDTLQPVALMAVLTAGSVLPEAKFDDDDDLDDDFDQDIGGQGHKDSLIDNDIGELCSEITDEDRLDLATQTQWMLEMLLKHQALWKAEQKLEWEGKMAKREQMAAKCNQWAAEHAKWAEHAEWSTAGQKTHIYKMVDPVRQYGGVKQLDWFPEALRSNFNSQGTQFPCGGPDHLKYVIPLRDRWSNHQTQD